MKLQMLLRQKKEKKGFKVAKLFKYFVILFKYLNIFLLSYFCYLPSSKHGTSWRSKSRADENRWCCCSKIWNSMSSVIFVLNTKWINEMNYYCHNIWYLYYINNIMQICWYKFGLKANQRKFRLNFFDFF